MLATKKIVVIAPIKNESWILEQFLRACSEFADHIIIGDHFSTDNSRELVKSFAKVTLISANNAGFNESERRNQLLVEARKFGMQNLIFSLDADEFLSAPLKGSDTLNFMLAQQAGTHFRMSFLNLRPNLTNGWLTRTDAVAFIDDGSLHLQTDVIHFPRLPRASESITLDVENLLVIHLQYIDNSRMKSKHQWYKVWERINFPSKPAIEIYRRYNHMHSVNAKNTIDLPILTQDYFSDLGIHLPSLAKRKHAYWWDREVSALIEKHGSRIFRFILEANSPAKDSFIQKIFFAYAKRTQAAMKLSTFNPLRLTVRLLDKTLFRLWV